MRSDLPTGSVTFLFTDIEGSTKLLRDLGPEGYAHTLAEHRRLMREAFVAHGGVEVDTQGDAFFVAFADAGEALAAAREAQQALSAQAIRVRMGLHSGEPLLTEEGYVGVDVHKAARICAVGHGGQLLVSWQVKLQVDNADLRPLGSHRLKDLTAPEPLYQLGDAEFPPLRSLNQSNLPEQPTPFDGRERELNEVLQLLRREDVRLLTLTGPGGSGKTRLALQAAADLVEEQEHGVWWVGLQAVRTPSLVLSTIASTLGASGDLAAHVANKQMLVLLDNIEQVIEAAPELGELVTSCPNLTVLVTSREPLHLAVEHEYPVPPLAAPEAIAFFLARATAVRPDLSRNGAVGAICHRLDYLPLALELAAARVRALSPAQILARLEQRLPLLTGGPRDAPKRQRTLHATIEWSYELLTMEEQRIFRRLSVFAGGGSLAAAESILDAELDALQSIVEKSLLRFNQERYVMLETVREYAAEQLEGCGEADAVHRRHAEFFLELAKSAGLSAEAESGRRHDIVLLEQDNLRAAIDWAVAGGDIELGLRLAIALENFWVSNDPFEGVRRFETLLAKSGDLPAILRARALRCYGGSCHMAGHHEQSQRALEESLTLFRDTGDERDIAVVLHRLGTNELQLGKPELARERLEESLVMFQRTGSPRGEAQVIGSLGYVARAEGDVGRAVELFEQSLDMIAGLGFIWWQIGMLDALADCALNTGRIDDARARAREQLSLARQIADRQSTVFALAYLACVAAERGDTARAGRLWGAIEAEAERKSVGQWENERDQFGERLRSHAGAAFDRALEEGRQLSLQVAVSEALEADHG